jgi:hypothetical protein
MITNVTNKESRVLTSINKMARLNGNIDTHCKNWDNKTKLMPLFTSVFGLVPSLRLFPSRVICKLRGGVSLVRHLTTPSLARLVVCVGLAFDITII